MNKYFHFNRFCDNDNSSNNNNNSTVGSTRYNMEFCVGLSRKYPVLYLWYGLHRWHKQRWHSKPQPLRQTNVWRKLASHSNIISICKKYICFIRNYLYFCNVIFYNKKNIIILSLINLGSCLEYAYII